MGYDQPFTTNQHRTDAPPDRRHTYIRDRNHTSLGGKPPITRVNDPPRHYSEMRTSTCAVAAGSLLAGGGERGGVLGAEGVLQVFGGVVQVDPRHLGADR